MAKPTDVARWATDAGAGIVEPNSGTKDLGFAPGQRPPAQYLDYLFNRAYQWHNWLDTIVAPAAGSEPVTMSSAGVLAANGKHGERTLLINTSDFTIEESDGGVGNTVTRRELSLGGADDDYVASVAIPLKAGDRIRSVSAYVGPGISNDWDLQLVGVPRDGVPAAEETIATTNFTTGGLKTLSAIDRTLEDDTTYAVLVRHDSDGSACTVDVTGLFIVFDRP